MRTYPDVTYADIVKRTNINSIVNNRDGVIKLNKFKIGKNRKFINTTLILKNLPPGCTTIQLLEYFKECGAIKFINIMKDENGKCEGLAFIRFCAQEGSEKGLEIDGFWFGNRKIFVEYARDRRE